MKPTILFFCTNAGAVFVPGIKGVIRSVSVCKRDATTEANFDVSAGTAVPSVALPAAQTLSGSVTTGPFIHTTFGLSQTGLFQFPCQQPIDSQSAITVDVSGGTDLSDVSVEVEIS